MNSYGAQIPLLGFRGLSVLAFKVDGAHDRTWLETDTILNRKPTEEEQAHSTQHSKRHMKQMSEFINVGLN